jgi:exopolysaccharide/PEP-CTERM locus tyrosine autokinase
LSFIDKALERAKQLHQKKQQPEPQELASPPSPDPLRFPDAPPPFLDAGSQTPLEEINYSQTRTVPVNHEVMRRHRLITDLDGSLMAEEYKLIRTHILQRTRSQGKNVLMVTGPMAGEGKTLTSINLAIAIGQEMSHTALLVDLDLRFPSVTDYLGIRVKKGVVDYFKSGISIPELLIHPEGLGKLVILPAGRPVAEAVELLSSPQMVELVREMKHFYPDRYIIFDLPPVLYYADALAFAPLMDGIIMVVEAGRTAREDIVRAADLLKGFPVMGFVLNKLDSAPRAYSYYDRYYRDRNYKKKKGWGFRSK